MTISVDQHKKDTWLKAGYTMVVFWEEPLLDTIVTKYFPTVEEDTKGHMAKLLRRSWHSGRISGIGCVKIEDM
jgi:hypothetical protein